MTVRPVEDPTPEPLPPEPAPDSPPRGRRRRAAAIGAAVIGAALAAFALHALATRGEESTDDAQVEADVVAIAPRVGGAVAQVLVRENQHVRKGDPLVLLDDADLAARVRQVEAGLETARAQAAAADAQVAVSLAGLRRADADARKATLDLDRARSLRAGDAIAADRLDAAEAASETGHATVSASSAQIAAARAGATLARARVSSAEAELHLARLQLSYARIAAPADGLVAKLSAREGQILQAGQPVAQLVPDATYLVANFKETEVGGIRPGQRAVIEVDAYPGRKLEGRVESVSGGTGARFALLPPDNASGNFVKVVERVPVRIAWVSPPADLALRAGLSALVRVRVRR